jgi:hypothetical protein
LFTAVSGPGPREPGLHLLRIEASVAGEHLGGLVSGRLVVPRAFGPAAALAKLHALTLTVVSELNQAKFTARLIGRQPLAINLPQVADQPELCGVDFNFDLEAFMGTRLWPERFFVRLGARELVSSVVDYVHRPSDGERTESLVRGLPLAYAALRHGNEEYAYRLFRAALNDAAVAADLDGAHHYNAACTACLLASQRRAARPPVDDRELVEAAMTWLDRESGALAARWDELQASRASSSDPVEQQLRTRQLEQLRARVAWMRLDDRDLERLRGELKIDPRLRQAGMLARLDPDR